MTPTATKKAGKKKDTGKGQVLVTSATFDTRTPLLRFIHHADPIAKAIQIDGRHYHPSGGTPLNDAVLALIRNVDKQVLRHPDAIHVAALLDESGSMHGLEGSVIGGFNEFVGALRGEKPKGQGRVLFLVMTDGYENASEATTEALREEIAKREAGEWTFIYLGANQDAWVEGGGARGMSVSANYQATAQGTSDALRSSSDIAASYLGDLGTLEKSQRDSLVSSRLRSSLGDTGNTPTGNNVIASGAKFNITNSTFNLAEAIGKAKGEPEKEEEA